MACSEVVEVDPTTGKETLISSNSIPVNASSQYFVYAQGIVTDRAGDIFVADPLAFGGNGGIIEVNPTTGKESELSANSMPVNALSQYFHSPSQLTLYPAGNILVADWCSTKLGCGGIIEVDPQTGKETELSTYSMPVNASSQYFDEPTAVAVDGNGRIVTVQEGGLGGLRGAVLAAVRGPRHRQGERVVGQQPRGQQPQRILRRAVRRRGGSLAHVTISTERTRERTGAPVRGALARRLRARRLGQARHQRTRAIASTLAGADASLPTDDPAAPPTERCSCSISPRRSRSSSPSPSAGAELTVPASRPARATATAAPAPMPRRRHCTIHAHAGKNTPRFAGSLSHGRTLGPGSYELTVMAESAAGTWVARRPLRFTIVA